LRSSVIAPVRLLTKEEKVTSANSTVHTAYARSSVLRGTTSIEAGVNCVRDQWSDVEYLYQKLRSGSPLNFTQVSTALTSSPSVPTP